MADSEEYFDEDKTGREIQKLKEEHKRLLKLSMEASGRKMVDQEIPSGIQNISGKKHLLPHFTMCLVGKPASGKSTLMEKLITDNNFYKDMFDDVLVVSPSLSKLNFDIDEQNTSPTFDFDWIFDRLYKINARQLRKLQHNYMEQDQDVQYAKRLAQAPSGTQFSKVFQRQLGQNTVVPSASIATAKSSLSLNDYVNLLNRIYKDKAPQNIQNISTMIQMGAAQATTKSAQTNFGFIRPKQAQAGGLKPPQFESRKERNARQKQKINLIQKYADQIHELFKLNVGSVDHMKESHVNVLLLLDDVIGEISREQHSFQLAKIFLNRRHLIANGTVSIIVSTQKYTMIPARIRSSSNWFQLFRLSPNDLELVRTDATAFQKRTWESILKYVFGEGIVDKQGKIKEIQGDDHEHKKDYKYLSIHVDGNNNQLFSETSEFQVN